MANYYLSGHTTPAGVSDRAGVRAIQQQLNAQGANLKVDGVWGPKTQAAYAASSMANQNQTAAAQQQAAASFNYGTTDLDALQSQIYSKLSAPSISYSMPSQQELAAQISAYLRPSYENAIAQRQQQTLYNRSQIDADAASRGMGRSTYVTDVKDQAMDAEAADIAALESNYNAALLEAVQGQYNQHLQNKLAADQYNAQAAAAAQQAALQYSMGLYQNNLAREEAAQAAASVRRSSGTLIDPPDPLDPPAPVKLGINAQNILGQMARLYSSQDEAYWQDEIVNAYSNGRITKDEADTLMKKAYGQ